MPEFQSLPETDVDAMPKLTGTSGAVAEEEERVVFGSPTPPEKQETKPSLHYLIEVFVDDFIVLAIQRSQEDLRHIANTVLQRINDVIPPDEIDDDDAISLKKVLKREGAWAVINEILGFEFDGNPHKHTVWLTPDCRDALLLPLKHWIRGSSRTPRMESCSRISTRQHRNYDMHSF